MESEGTHHNEFRRVVQSVREQPVLFVAFTSYKTFAVLIFMEGFFFQRTFQAGSFTLPILVPFLLICAAVCMFFAFRFKKIKVFGKSEYLWSLAACMVFGVFSLFMEAHAGIANETLRLLTLGLGMALLGVGFMGIHIELGRVFGMLGMTPTLTFGIASTLATAVIILGLSVVAEPIIIWIIIFALPVVIALSFYCAKQSAFPDQKVLYRKSATDLLIPYRFMATSIIQGLALGIPLGFVSLSGYFGQVIDSAGYLVAALLALVVVLMLKMDFNRTIYQIGFPIAACGLLVLGMFGQTVIAGVLQIAGFIYLDLVLWGLGSYLIKNCDQPATWVASCPTSALMTGRAFGVVIGSIALQALVDPAQKAVFFCCMAFLVLLGALLLSSDSNLRTGWGFVRPGASSESDDSFRMCQVIAQDFGLTQRELEIMHSIIIGKSRRDIAEDMFITPNTIKTHLHNLYGKLDIHSESDLKAFVIKRGKIFSATPESTSIPVDE
ncbi:MAG: helix-turn-helix transcriptional regulator [Raoultibacter sp.]